MTQNSSAPHVQPDHINEHDPNLRQAMASNPLGSVWVSASAGTGKTKILTDRVLRLMLPRPGMPLDTATAPDKILCLTFTKTAASEMADRIHERLAKWSIMPDQDLRDNLSDLLQKDPTDDIMGAARALFARVVDTPGGMKIMTIHSFCQSVLKRFPLEAGLPAHFEVLDERTSLEYLQQAQRLVISGIDQSADSPLSQAFEALSNEVNADQFHDLMRDLTSNRTELRHLKSTYETADELRTALLLKADCHAYDSEKSILEREMNPCAETENALKTGIDSLLGGKASDINLGQALQQFFECTPDLRASCFDAYTQGFLKQDGDIRARLMNKDCINANPGLLDIVEREAQRLYDLTQKIKSYHVAINTTHLMHVGFEIINRYEQIKSAALQLDYDDLIDYTRRLLSSPERAAWVLYKMDQGLDHILVDEAQDTSPAQWQIVRTLAEEFFSGQSARDDIERTLFVVGDEKQSIFSFQGADPAEFQKMRIYFAEHIEQAGKQFDNVNLLVSFRSTAAVLGSVDHIFSNNVIATGVQTDLSEPVRHIPFREGQAGHIELWPPVKGDEKETPAPWTPPVHLISADNADVKLAAKIADTISGWLEGSEILTSQNRPVRAGDIMILFRTRGPLIEHILRALKDRNIPVSGIDRMVLTDHLAVQDCLLMGEFGLLPEDDLTLATALKSPFIGYSEDQLYRLAYGRTSSLWRNLREQDMDTYTYLNRIKRDARRMSPFDFLSTLLTTPCPANATSGRSALYARLGLEIDDAIDEILNAAMDFERLHTPMLQKFLFWIKQGTAEVKREQDSSHTDQVRLMTVHASKGLQAPIVFLPETTSTPRNLFQVMWPDTESDLPLWAPRAAQRDRNITDRIEKAATAQLEEYRRLLYVALTRAEDRFYVCGAAGHKTIKDDSWYGICRLMLQSLDNIQEQVFEIDGQTVLNESGQPMPALIYKTAQTAKYKDKKATRVTRTIADIKPDWLHAPPPDEPDPPRPLAPSRPSEDEPAVRSPIAADDHYRYARGILIHQLLEFLPELPAEKRRAACESYLAKPAHKLDNRQQSETADEIMYILENPDFAPLFGDNSSAEVPVTGLIQTLEGHTNYAISGQIDRMVVEDDRILIVDYKTNRPPPVRVEDVQPVYLRQMAAYQTVLEQIYTDKKIECLLLWTDAPRLMHLPDEMIKKYRKT